MQVSNEDLVTGRRLVHTLVDWSATPPAVKRPFQSLGRLHAELRLLGFQLRKKEPFGTEAGFQLFYTKGNVLVRIKTRGAEAKGRPKVRSLSELTPLQREEYLERLHLHGRGRGQPHFTVSIVSGKRDDIGRLDTSYSQELGKIHVGGGLVNKAPIGNGLYGKSGVGKANADSWADGTHFDFPDGDLDDSCIDDLRAS
jgi:hypothetical protein